MYLKFLVASVLLASVQAFAFPMPRGLAPKQLPRTFTQNYNFDGIVALDDCSGSIVRFETSLPTDQAMVLTNGHCYEGGMPEPGQVVSRQPSGRSFAILDEGAQQIGTLTAIQVIYSTMTKTDITLYKLQESYDMIEKQLGRHALVLSSKHPELSAAMEVISGYWQRGYTCKIESFVNQLNEDRWSFVDSIRYSQPGCETIGGTSGSPIVEVGTRNVIGINNTGNDSGEQCTMNNPCEVDKDGKVTAQKGLSYGQQTYWISTCVNSNREFDLTVPGCILPH